jgi:hypothetical protein
VARGAIQVKIEGKYDDKDLNRAIRDLERLKTQSAAATGPMAGLGKSLLAAGAGFASFALVGQAIDFLKDAAAAAVEEDKAVQSLAKSLANVGQARLAASAESFVSSMQREVAVADDQLRPALQTLVSATGDLTKAQDLLGYALDASAATGKDLNTVTLAIAKASNGQLGALTRLGIPLDQNIVKTKDFSAALGVMNERFGGQAATAAQTYAGRIAAISIELDEAREKIGRAVLGAVDDLTAAFGGEDGLKGGIKAASDEIAKFITTVGVLVEQVVLLNKEFNKATEAVGGFGGIIEGIISMVPGMGPLVDTMKNVKDVSDQVNESQAKSEATVSLLRMGVAMLRDHLGTTTESWVDLALAGDEATEGMKEARTASDLLKASLDRFTTGDDYIQALRAVGKAAKDAKGDLTGNKDASIDLRAEFGSAASAALAYATANGTSAADVLRIWDEKLGQLRTRLIANKVKPKDVDEFINERLWLTRFQLLADVIGKGQAAEAMRLAGLAAGKRAWQGIVAGLDAGRDEVASAANRTAQAANRGAQEALEINSPSRTFYRLGKGATEGLALGLDEGAPAVVKSAADLIAKVAGAAAASARESVDSGLGAVQSISDSILGTVLGGVRLSGQDAEGNALTPEQMVTALFGDIAAQRQAVSMLAASVGDTLPPELLQQFLSAGPQVAQGLATLFAKNPALAEQLALAYDELGIFTQEALGIPMGLAWGKVGEDSARELLLNARSALAARAEGFARWVSNNLAVTIPYRFEGPAGGIDGARANGGPVSAGGTYLVGERGPELLHMGSASGSITPTHKMGGASVNVTVNAGMGADGYQIGQQVVDAIKKYERVAGPVFAKAS